ncbi:MAG: hypothetical protein ACLP8S_05970 [Solirubrobacteraceae bacterium]
MALAIALELLLPRRFSLGPNWTVPTLELLLIVAAVIADRGRVESRSTVGRALSLALAIVLVAEAAGITVRLVVDLIEGGPETNSPTELLGTGFGIWLYTIIAFAFVYWVLDGGGPQERAVALPEFPDLAFPEQMNSHVAPPDWRPEFSDYLYLGFTNATAFSPTDVMPLSRWAKLTMAIQAADSLLILGLVIARAINILK